MSLLREREFRRFWLAQSISLLGDQVAVIALPLVAVLVLDAGPAQMGLLGAAALFPHLLFSLPAGVWLDRVAERRRVMIAADLGRAALVATIPFAYALDVLTLAQLYVVAFLAGSLAVAFDLRIRRSSSRSHRASAIWKGTRSSTGAAPSRSSPGRRSAACLCRPSARRSRCSPTLSPSSSRPPS
jgi:MFS family permease